MKAYFIDTSALLKRYLKEAGSDVVDAVFEEYAVRYVSGIGLLESFSNLQRLEIEAAIRLLSDCCLTAVDALQIVTAQSLGPETVFVSSDMKLNLVAERQGLTVLDPAKA